MASSAVASASVSVLDGLGDGCRRFDRRLDRIGHLDDRRGAASAAGGASTISTGVSAAGGADGLRLGHDGFGDGSARPATASTGGRLDRFDGRDGAGSGGLADELIERGGTGRGAGLFERWRLGHLGGHRAELGRIVDLLETDEEGIHLGFVLGDAGLDVLDLALDEGGMAFEAQLELLLALGDALLGLGPDARDLGLRPVLDAGDVLVGYTAQAVDLFGGSGMDAFDRPVPSVRMLSSRLLRLSSAVERMARTRSASRRDGGRAADVRLVVAAGLADGGRRRGRSIDGARLVSGRPGIWLSGRGSLLRRGRVIRGR